MNWMLVVMVFGTQPVKTDLVFDSLEKCEVAGDLMRSEQLSRFYGWQSDARKTGGFWKLWNEEALTKRRLGMENETTCVPQSLK
jgi:hypothetical protein